MAKVCLCLTGRTLAKDLEILEKYRSYVDVAELRVDYLDADERFHLRRFPELAGIPTILTVRRKVDGGKFIEGEGARIVLLASGLAFADTDRRRNFAYVDLEEDLNVPSLEEAARTFGTRIIRSYHNFSGVDADMLPRLKAMRRTGDEIVKAAVMPHSLDDVARVYRTAREAGEMDKILLCMGPFGTSTRILAERLGSFMSYTTPKGEAGIESAAPGQLDPRELVETYRFRSITAGSRIFGIIGSPLAVTSSPEIHNQAYDRSRTDAVYIPLRADSLDFFFKLADEIGLAGASVTIPHKEAIVPYLDHPSAEVSALGSCNTIVRGADGWYGYDTDTRGFSDSLLAFIGKTHLRRKRICVVGAGGVGRAVVAEIKRLGGRACVLNRTAVRARNLAEPYGFAWGGLDSRGVELVHHYADVIVQTTSVGMEGAEPGDPLELYKFSGKEVVMDLIYKPERTPFLRRAEAAGCRVLNGYDMLVRQAKRQYRLFTGQDFPD
jgi:3-dehydroquinate dehydratase/shikimate dehydrogenase